jgi:hypothetical protein
MRSEAGRGVEKNKEGEDLRSEQIGGVVRGTARRRQLARGRRAAFHMRQYLLNDELIFNARNDLHRAAAVLAHGHVDQKDSFQALRPRHGDMAWDRVRALPALRLLFPNAGLSAARGGYDPSAQAMMGREDSMVASQVDPWATTSCPLSAVRSGTCNSSFTPWAKAKWVATRSQAGPCIWRASSFLPRAGDSRYASGQARNKGPGASFGLVLRRL